jgi:hypothetical protein
LTSGGIVGSANKPSLINATFPGSAVEKTKKNQPPRIYQPCFYSLLPAILQTQTAQTEGQ